ncbi:hypothetical protein NIES4073_81720 [Kalymmatonema gypsitolerans NIES-4073]|nr:hypothetical protein NIES4073_81720 [Scytonema sp. NIES-4073]
MAYRLWRNVNFAQELRAGQLHTKGSATCRCLEDGETASSSQRRVGNGFPHVETAVRMTVFGELERDC